MDIRGIRRESKRHNRPKKVRWRPKPPKRRDANRPPAPEWRDEKEAP